MEMKLKTKRMQIILQTERNSRIQQNNIKVDLIKEQPIVCPSRQYIEKHQELSYAAKD